MQRPRVLKDFPGGGRFMQQLTLSLFFLLPVGQPGSGWIQPLSDATDPPGHELLFDSDRLAAEEQTLNVALRVLQRTAVLNAAGLADFAR